MYWSYDSIHAIKWSDNGMCTKMVAGRLLCKYINLCFYYNLMIANATSLISSICLTSNMAFYVGGMRYHTCTYHWKGGFAYILILPWSLMASQILLLFLHTNTNHVYIKMKSHHYILVLHFICKVHQYIAWCMYSSAAYCMVHVKFRSILHCIHKVQ